MTGEKNNEQKWSKKGTYFFENRNLMTRKYHD